MLTTISAKKLKRLPEWLKKDVLLTENSRKVYSLVQEFNLHTVCQIAKCPNRNECFSSGTAAFMILGDICTRGCTFCSVSKGKPQSLVDLKEPDAIASIAKVLQLKHIVITSVNRDDLPDQGSTHFATTIKALRMREETSNIVIEILTPDFRGNKECIKKIVLAEPDIYNHNLETVPSLYKRVRPGAIYQRSLGLIKFVKETNEDIITKSGIMLGLGEELEEVIQVMNDLHNYKCDYLTLGQYLQPTRNSYPIYRYLEPKEFDKLKLIALNIGFKKVFSGPLVRSSYHAEEFHKS